MGTSNQATGDVSGEGSASADHSYTVSGPYRWIGWVVAIDLVLVVAAVAAGKLLGVPVIAGLLAGWALLLGGVCVVLAVAVFVYRLVTGG